MVLFVLGACFNTASAQEANLILVNGKVWTENPAQPSAQAVALDSSRILAVGDNAAIRKLARPDTRVIDLGGRLAIPGFIEGKVDARVVPQKSDGGEPSAIGGLC